MTLSFTTGNAAQLKRDIIKKVEDDELVTWTIHEAGDNKFLKHTKQWGEKGVIGLTANGKNDLLIVKVRKFSKYEGAVEDFEGYYLGRFCEVMFVNFHTEFGSIIKS